LALAWLDYVEENKEEKSTDASLKGQSRQASKHGAWLVTTVAEFVIGGPLGPWDAVGIHFSPDGVANVGNTWLRCDRNLTPGIHSWALFEAPHRDDSIDGLITTHVDELPQLGETIGESDGSFRLDIAGVDHVVVNTPDLHRTSDAIAVATGGSLKRVRDAGNGMQQGFHRLGGVIVEIVSTRQSKIGPESKVGPASFWGLVFVVDDLDAVFDHLGTDLLSPPKPAVQPELRIATFRAEAKLGIPCALMSR